MAGFPPSEKQCDDEKYKEKKIGSEQEFVKTS